MRLAKRQIPLRTPVFDAVLERGSLRWLSIRGVEVVRGIYGAFRDADWGTIEPTFTRYEVAQSRRGFEVRFTAVHRRDEIDFVWDGRIDGDPDGIRYGMDGRARSSFMTNRIGLCVLFPAGASGRPISIGTPWGRMDGRLPMDIVAVTPFTNIQSMALDLGGERRISIDFSGDLFELEDQRNWSDASFKTFSTPLSLPAPRSVESGNEVRQLVMVRSPQPRGRRPSRRPPRQKVILGQSAGPMPAIGICASHPGTKIDAAIVARARALDLSHLRVQVTLPDDLQGADLQNQLDEAVAISLPIELEIRTTPDGAAIEALLRRILAAGVGVARLLVFDHRTFTTTSAQLRAASAAATELRIETSVGGGSCGDFAELNQRRPPVEGMDVLGYRITPQVHAFDDASIMENLAGQTATVQSARVLGGGRPITVGPVTLRGLLNPVAADPGRVAVDPAAAADPRQATLFGAAWTVGSIAALSSAGVASITIHRLAGSAGLQPAAAEARSSNHPAAAAVHPAYHVLAELGRSRGPLERIEVENTDPDGIATLAVQAPNDLRVLIANLTAEQRSTTLRMPAGPASLRRLDRRTVTTATREPDRFRASSWMISASNQVELDLAPYAVAIIAQGAAVRSGE